MSCRPKVKQDAHPMRRPVDTHPYICPLTERTVSPIAVPVTPVKRPQTRPPSPPSISDKRRAKAARPYTCKFGNDEDDEDASWSTLGAARRDSRGRPTFLSGRERGRGKNETRPSGGIKRSGVFKLPGLGIGGAKSGARCVDVGDTSSHPKRRVITYLPPPMEHQVNTNVGGTCRDQSGLDEGVSKGTELTEEIDHGMEDKGDMSDNDRDYDVPAPRMDSDEATLVGEYEWHVQPASSPVQSVPFDTDQVCARYADVRARMKKVRSCICS